MHLEDKKMEKVKIVGGCVHEAECLIYVTLVVCLIISLAYIVVDTGYVTHGSILSGIIPFVLMIC